MVTTMFDVEILETCTLQQACEWIAFQRPPMTTTQEEASGFIRPSPEIAQETIWSKHLPKPTYTWEDYLQQMTIACAKLKLALIQKDICVFGKNKDFPTLLFPQPQSINISEDDNLNWEQNIISSTFFYFSKYIHKIFRINQGVYRSKHMEKANDSFAKIRR